MNSIFDYQSVARCFQIPENVVRKVEKEVKKEIPNDNMIMELHILRALNAYVNRHKLVDVQ